MVFAAAGHFGTARVRQSPRDAAIGSLLIPLAATTHALRYTGFLRNAMHRVEHSRPSRLESKLDHAMLRVAMAARAPEPETASR